MRIGLVSEFFYPTLGGVQEHLYNVAKAYRERGHEVGIVTPNIFKAPPFKEWWPKDLPESCHRPVGYSLPYFVNGSRGRTTVGVFMGTQLRRLLSPKNFDLIHLHAPLNGTLPIMANHFSRVPVVGTFHTSFPSSKSLKMFAPLAQRQIDKLSAVLAVSPSSLKSIRNFVDIDEAEVIPNGIDIGIFKPRWEISDAQVERERASLPWTQEKGTKILFIGRPDPRNGLDTLLKAFARVIVKRPDARLIVAGGGEEMARYQAIAKFLPAGSVYFLGAIRDERPEVYRHCDVHVFGVEKAAFSITLLEGMASGLSIVTTRFEGVEAAGRDGEHFLTSEFGDEVELEQRLLTLIDDAALRRKLGEGARLHAMKYDWLKIADQLLAIYSRVLRDEERRVAVKSS